MTEKKTRYIPMPIELVQKIDLDRTLKGFPNRKTYFEELCKRFEPMKDLDKKKDKKKTMWGDDFIDFPIFK